MQGRTAVVTGATNGIGEVTARELARAGADVAVLGRNPERCEATRGRIREATGRDVRVFVADFESLDAVRRLAGELLEALPGIHLLVNNAAIVNLRRQESADGIEATFAVNHLAPFLLTNLLLDRIRETPDARIVNVASEAHRFGGGINWDDLGFERDYGVAKVYGQSKLANILFTLELARRLEGSGVTANSLHPGGVSTGLGENNAPGWLRPILKTLIRPFLKSPEQGAETSLYLSTSDEVAGTSGLYFARCKPKRPKQNATDPEAAERLWRISEELTGLA